MKTCAVVEPRQMRIKNLSGLSAAQSPLEDLTAMHEHVDIYKTIIEIEILNE